MYTVYPINKPAKTWKSRIFNEENFCTTRKGYEFQEKISVICWEECRKGFNFCWRFKAIVEPKSAPQKIKFWGVIHVTGAYFHVFKTSDQIGHTAAWGPKNW